MNLVILEIDMILYQIFKLLHYIMIYFVFSDQLLVNVMECFLARGDIFRAKV
jgi:hypothetical protein